MDKFIDVKDRSKLTIFVEIVSFRDTECQWTVKSLYDSATYPGRVSCGVVWQYDPDRDSNCFQYTASEHATRIRTLYVHYTLARGPAWARSRAEKLWSGEQFILQIDSHMRFVPGWDVELLDQLFACSSLKPIITTYPAGYEIGKSLPTTREPNVLCADKFGVEDGILRITGKAVARPFDVPQPALFWAAGFVFGPAQMIADVPYDPLPNLFYGEEVAMAARLWTSGWDFFTPSRMILYHLWSRQHRPSFRDHLKAPIERARELKSRARVKRLLGISTDPPPPQPPFATATATATAAVATDTATASRIPTAVSSAASASASAPARGSAGSAGATSRPAPADGKYGLGRVRSLADWERHTGVSFGQSAISERARFGGLDPKSAPFPGSVMADRLASVMQLLAAQSASSNASTPTAAAAAAAPAPAKTPVAAAADMSAPGAGVGGLLAALLTDASLPDVD